MNKQLLLAVSLLPVFFWAKGQKPDTAWLMVHYKFSHIRDTANRDHPLTENMVLFLGKNASVYRSYDGFVADQQYKKAYIEALGTSPDGHGPNRRGAGSRTLYYQYPREQRMFTNEDIMGANYLIENPLPVIDWKIGADTATFGGLHCQKATCHFSGRDYIVWFCPDLPVHAGPWKLNGLPGVIVDAQDTKDDVEFKFGGVEKTTASLQIPGIAGKEDKDIPPIIRDLKDDPNVIVPPASAIKTTQKEYDKLHATMMKDPGAFAQALNAANDHGDGPKMDHIIVGPKRPGTGPVINNPIELPEK